MELSKEEKMKKYKREYYKQKYQNDEVFKAKKQLANRLRYQRKTINCEKCNFRINKEFESTLCSSCLIGEQNQIKSNRGRKKKIENNISFNENI